MVRSLSRHGLLTALLTLVPTIALAQEQVIIHDCYGGAGSSSRGGWQAPGATPASGTNGCGPDSTIILWASHDAYAQALRLTPDMPNVTVETELLLLARDGSPGEDAFSLLLHWSGSSDPSVCCTPVHAASGLRIQFNLSRSRMEVYQETGGSTTGPLATLPFSLPLDTLRTLKVSLHGTTLDLTVGGALVGSVTVPATPPSLFGFDARRLDIRFAPFRLTIGCTGDADCDGIADGTDNCPATAGADQTDTDGDGLGNLCDPDDDGDGIADAGDRCPLVPNPLQEDADNDLIGDACDVCPADPTNDADGDRICGQSDNCPSDANPDQGNLDGDAQGDVCDLNDGHIVIRWVDQTRMTWQREAVFNGYNLYRRSVADLRATHAYVLDPNSLPGPIDERTCNKVNDLAVSDPPLGPGEAVAYFVTGSTGGIEGSLGRDSRGDERPNPYPCGCDRPFVTVLSGLDGPAAPEHRLIDNLADWCAFRPASCASGLVDFGTEVAIVVAPGPQVGCFGLHVTCIETGATSSEVQVRYQEVESSGPTCNCQMVIGSPFEVVKIARPATTATFEGSVALMPCP
jgi:hypothetical protein